MAHREDTCWGKAKYRVVVTQILATRVEAFGLPADWHVTPPPPSCTGQRLGGNCDIQILVESDTTGQRGTARVGDLPGKTILPGLPHARAA